MSPKFTKRREKYAEAVDNFQTAGEYYDTEKNPSLSNQCFLKVAQYSAELGDYSRAVENFEQVANVSMESKLLKYGVKEYFLKAGICHLCNNDLVAAKSALEKYIDMDASFSNHLECKFLKEITDAVEKYDVDSFTSAVREYDNIVKLDSWKTSLLLKIKKSMVRQDDNDNEENENETPLT